jgi:50S ribosomal protein L16 3-hydroxylase
VPTDEWVLEPGDILYVPPRFAHNGVAIGDDCMTYSIGFRAPSRSELIEAWSDHLLSALTDDDRFADPDLAAPANPGEIAPDALDRLHTMVSAGLADRAAFARWFGGFTSTPKYPEIDWSPEEPIAAVELADLRSRGGALTRNPASRFAFVRGDADAIVLFVDGGSLDCAGPTAALAERLCAADEILVSAAELAEDAAFALISELLGRGALAII